MTIIVNDQNGLWSRYANWMSRFTLATTMPTTRAQFAPDEDPEPGEQHDDADDQRHPTPGLDIVRDRQLPADVAVRCSASA